MSGYIEAPARFGRYSHHPAADIHPEATIGRDVIIDLARIGMAEIGKRTEIGNFTTVMDEASIGEYCSVRRNVVIHEEVVIGTKVEIQDQASVPTGTTVQSCAFIGPGANLLMNHIREPSSPSGRGGFRRPSFVSGLRSELTLR